MRHGEAESGSLNGSDASRNLSLFGKEQARISANLLKDLLTGKFLLLASDAARTTQTARIVYEIVKDNSSEYQEESELYLAPGDLILDTVRILEDAHDACLIIGHNPGLSELAFHLGYKGAGLNPAAFIAFNLNIKNWPEVLSKNSSVHMIHNNC